MKKALKKITLLLFIIIMAMLIFQFIVSNQVEDSPLPTKLHPTVAEAKDKLISQTKANGITIIITDGFRSIAEQDALFEQGRTTDGNIVTNVRGGDSYHNYGLAIDFALQLEDGSVIWDLEYDGNDNGKADWMEVVEIAKKLGFTWGGDWDNFRDYPHLQMDFDLSIRALKRGKRPDENTN